MTSRPHILLDGIWQFWIDPAECLTPAALTPETASSINVPAPWQSQSDDLRNYSGTAWYRRQFEIPAEWPQESAIILKFGAVDYFSVVYVNGEKVGENEGGYLPFEFDITPFLIPGVNSLAVRVADPPEIFAEIPHGKQGWYGPLSGIWQSVWVERRAPAFTRSVGVHADLHSGSVRAEVVFSDGFRNPMQVEIAVIDELGEVVSSVTGSISSGGKLLMYDLSVSDPVPWAPDHPYLYHLRVRLSDESGIVDELSKQFGFRTIEARDGKIYLNGEVIYLRGVLDQDYYPDTIYTLPDEAFLEDQFTKAKELGINCLRLHIKAGDPRYYELADRMGFLVWTEIPNWGILSSRSKRLARELFMGILARDGHHPSIIAWTIINEDWGTDLVNDASHRSWLREMFQWVKEQDPTRLVIDNSPCEPNFHVQTDIEDYHFYRGIPDHRREWDEFIQTFASRAPFTFSPHQDIERTGKEPLVLSEFGNWGLPDVDQIKDKDGREPWWFTAGLEWSEGVVYPQGVKKRFNNLGLGRVFGSYTSFAAETQKQQFLALKYQIEAIRLQPAIQGYVITELADVHWECNGLLDMNRNPKVFHIELKNINAGTVVIPEWEQIAYAAGETVRVGISVAHGSGGSLEGAEVSWKLEGGLRNSFGSAMVPSIGAGSTRRVGFASFAAPDVSSPRRQRFIMELRNKDGEIISKNFVEFTFYPRRSGAPESLVNTTLFVQDEKLAVRLAELGYSMTPDLNKAQIAVAAKACREMLEFTQSGGRLLLLAGRLGGPGLVFPGIMAAVRKGTPWDGDWVSSFAWLERSGPFSRFPGGPLIDHAFDRVIPDYVLTGFKEWDFQRTVRSGLVVGWVHKPGVLIGEKDYGKGKVVITTYKLSDEALSADATAINLFDALMELVGKGLTAKYGISPEISTGTKAAYST